MAHNEDKLESLLQGMFARRTHEGTRQNCPDEERLAGYLSGLLPDHDKEAFEAHLAACSYCVDELVAAQKSAQDLATEVVPQRVMNRAMGLVPPKKAGEGVFDVVVRLVKDSLELVRTTGEWVTPLTAAPVGVRGRARPGDSSILQVEKQMGDFTVGIEVERVEPGMCQVAVSVAGQGGAPADNLRVSLLSGGREQASYLTKNGEAVFERIPQGAYDLQISDSGAAVGVVRLAME